MKLHWTAMLFFLVLAQDGRAQDCLSFFDSAEKAYENQYAQHFELKQKSNLVLVQSSSESYRVIYRDKKDLPKACREKELASVDSIVPTSTSMLHYFGLLEKEEVITGFPGRRYISSSSLRERVDAGQIQELGESFSLEPLILLDPDLILTQGEYSVLATGLERYQKFEEKRFSFLELKENHPLARAEWVVVLGALLGDLDQGVRVFQDIHKNYLKLQALVEKSQKSTKVLVGAFYQGQWFSPAPGSDFLQLLKDAGADLVTPVSKLGVNFENVLLNSRSADIWLPQASWQTIKEARSIDERHLLIFNQFENSQTFVLQKRAQGLEFWEKGVARPDLVLKDLAQIMGHLPQDELAFYAPLKHKGAHK